MDIERAEGTKGQRCWNYTTDVGSDPSVPTVAEAVTVILGGADMRASAVCQAGNRHMDEFAPRRMTHIMDGAS